MTPCFDAHCHIAVAAVTRPPGRITAPGRLLCGTQPADWHAVDVSSAAWAGSIPAFGLHPWHAALPANGVWVECLEALLAARPEAWVGEIGLDGGITGTVSGSAQEAAFARQLRLAARCGRPASLHCVKAWDSLLSILDAEYVHDGPRDFIVHGCGAPEPYAEKLAERGAYFSIGPLAFRHDSQRRRHMVSRLPEDRLLLESDAFLAPERDAVELLSTTMRWLAEVRRCEPAVLNRRLADNSRRIFHHGHT